MKYDFDEIINRRNTGSVKWDTAREDVLQMWIADMDFKTAPPITDALKKLAEGGLFGYSIIPDRYYDSILYWFDKIHHWKLEREWIINSIGVITSLNLLVRTFTEPGDKIIIQSPVYQHFRRAVVNNGRVLIDNPLKLVEGKYVMDYDDLEEKASNNEVKLLILCNPHNPVGRVWTSDELTRLGEICIKHNILVIADEIHCDLVLNGYNHIPFASLNEDFKMNSITCTSPTKTFNLAGLNVSNIIVPNESLRNKVKEAAEAAGVGKLNAFAVEATAAGYRYGEEWLKELLGYLEDNIRYLTNYIKEKVPLLKVIKTEGTYLVWIDCSELNISPQRYHHFFLKEAKLWINEGLSFGEGGRNYIRVNVACPRAVLAQGLQRIEEAIAKNTK